jgi:lysophospholipase L1-like esterase
MQRPAVDSAIFAHGALLMQRLKAGNTAASIVILGDSTGLVGSPFWPLGVAQRLGAAFPAYTVVYRVWNDTNQNYDAVGVGASQTVQVGTGTNNSGGPFTLTVWNGSVSGVNANYVTSTVTRFLAMVPATPDLIFLNFGHNNTGATTGYYDMQFPVVRSLRQQYPLAGVIQIAQNPRKTVDSEYANDLVRARVVKEISAYDGLGIVDITEKFLAYPSWETALMNDNVHPNYTGVALWLDEVMRHLKYTTSMVPRLPVHSTSMQWVPASAFEIYDGAPTFVTGASREAMWSLPDAADTSVVATVAVPSHWRTMSITAVYSVATGSGFSGSNNAAVLHSYSSMRGIGLTEILFASQTSQANPSWSHHQSAAVWSWGPAISVPTGFTRNTSPAVA